MKIKLKNIYGKKKDWNINNLIKFVNENLIYF